MALSKSLLEEIKKDTEDKRKGSKVDASSSKATGTQGSGSSSSGSGLSATIQNSIAMDLALKKMRVTQGRSSQKSSIAGYNDKDASNGWNAFLASKKKEKEKEEEKSWFEKALERMAGTSDTTLPGAAITTVTNEYRKDTSYREPTDKWSDQQKKEFGFLYSQDQEKAWQFAEELNNSIAKAAKDEQKKQVQEKATGSGWSGVAHTAGAIATAPMGLADYLNDIAEYNARGKITEKGDMLTPFEYSQAVTGGISEHLNEQGGTLREDIPIIGGKGWGDVYGLGVSAAQSMIGGKVLGQAGTLTSFFGSAAAGSIDDAKMRGATDEQALAFGTISGAAEVLTELVPLDNLMNMGAAANWKGLFADIIKQGGEEFLGEGANSIITSVADYLTFGDKSEYETLKRQYMENGLSEEAAAKAAFMEIVEGIAFDALGGFATGTASAGTIAGSATALNYGITQMQNAEMGKTIMAADGGVDALRQLANDVAGVSSEDMQQKITKQTGKVEKKETSRKVGSLYRTVQTANNLANASANQADIAKSLQRKGFNSETANDIAEALVANYNGQELTETQRKILKSAMANSTVQDAISNIITNNKSTMGQRSQNIRDFQKQIIQNTSRTEQTLPGQDNKSSESNLSGVENVASYEVSEDGKTHLISDPGKAVSVKGIASIENGKAKLALEDGSTVDAEDVSFGSEGEALVYETFVNLESNYGRTDKAIANMSTKSRNELISIYNPNINKDAGEFINGVVDAYFYGHQGIDMSASSKDSAMRSLTEQQKKIAWNEGRIAGMQSTKKGQSDIDSAYAEAQKVLKQTGKAKKGSHGAILADGITPMSLNNSQRAVYRLADEVAQGVQADIHVYASKTTEQGFYNSSTDEIWLNLNAAKNGREAIMAFTLAHELVHRGKKGSPAKYQAFVDFLMKEYGKQGSNVEAMIAEELAAAEEFDKKVPDNQKINMTREKALEEVVCDACQRMLLDTNAGQKLAEFGAQSKQNKSFLDDLKRWISDFMDKLRSTFRDVDPDSMAAKEFAKFDENVKQILADMYVDMSIEAGEKLSTIKAAASAVVKENSEAVSGDEIITDGAFVTDGGEIKYSLKSMKADIAEGKMFEDLMTVCGWSQKQVETLRHQLKDLVEYMTPFRDILDMNETYGREGRRFSPYKPNSDPLYKISMDFSTLCSKRLLTQYVIENLQLRENRPMSAEEQMAIRDMLNEYRKVEKGLQVACAMCYVEAARLKSPKQMQRWLDDPAPLLKDYFGKKNKAFNDSVKKAQADFKESKGYDREAPKKDMKPADVKELNKIGPKMRSQYKLSAEEQTIVDRAKTLPNSTYLTAGNLANLSETDPVIYDAYTAFVRTATRSKSLETDEPYYYGDSRRDNGNGIVVTDSFIEAVNRENGMRFSSWSDWRIQHLLDYITAVIDNSVRGAAMHGYTKFGDEVRVLGKTGMMFNMSGVAGTQTGLNEDGSLSFSPTESIDANEAIQLRDEFPDTAGLQCIGVGDDHIVALLRSDIIDYVIPYHVSGLNAALRRMADIHGWKDYTTTQHAAIDKSKKLEDAVDKEHWHEEPVYSEFFVGYNTGMTGIEAMKASAEKYKQMCRDRGLKPKFEQFANEDNYWKLLIDRKMINQKTGKLIQQKAVTPTFDFDTIKEVVDRHVQNYDAGLEARALNHIVENWDSIPKRIKDLKKQGNTKAKKAKKAADTLANQTLAAQPVEGQKQYSLPKVDSDGNQLSAEQNAFFAQSKVRDEQGRLIPMYHGTDTADFTVFDPQKSDDKISLFFTSDPDVANTYTQLQDKGRDVDPYNLITKDSSAEQFNKAQERVGGGLRVVKITPAWIQEMKAKADKSATRLFGVANKYADLLAYNNSTGMFNYDIERIREVTDKGIEKFKADDVNKLRKAMGSAEQHSFFAADHKGAAKEIRRIYHDTYKLFDEVWNYKIAASTPDSEIGQYTYTETNSSMPFMVDRSLDFLGNIIPGTEKEMVAKAIDRMKWVEDHHLGNRYKVYLNLVNPYIIDAGTDHSGMKKKVRCFYDYKAGNWTVTLDDVTLSIPAAEFIDFAERSFDYKAFGKIGHQIQVDEDAYKAEWGDLDPEYVNHDIELKNVEVNYIEPGQWNALKFQGDDHAKTRDVTAWAKEKGYDGVIFKNMKDAGGYAFMKGRGGSTVATAFRSEQVKSVDNKNPTSNPDLRYSLPKPRNFSYQELTAKPDLQGKVINSSQQVKMTGTGLVDEDWLVNLIKNKCDSVRTKSPEPKYFVNVPDIERNVEITRKGIHHALIRNKLTPSGKVPDAVLINAKAMVNLPEILANSIEVNRSQRGANIDVPFTRVMMGVTGIENNAGIDEYYAVRIMVEERANQDPILVEANVLGKLYAVNAKKISNPHAQVTTKGVALTTDRLFSYSVADVLNDVKTVFDNTFSADVYQKLNTSRKADDFSSHLLYKLPVGEDTSPRALLSNAFETIITNPIEKRNLQEYKGNVEMLNAEEKKLRELRAQIKELSFAKGKRDTKKIKDLQFEAIQTSNRIATLDKILLRFEASAPLQSILQREKEMVRKRERQRSDENLATYRKKEQERNAKWKNEVKEKYEASRKKVVETRDKREAREKLQKLVLDTAKWISHPAKTDVKCPDLLKQPYTDFLSSIDMSSERLAKGGDPTKNDLRLANAMGSLATALEKIMSSQDPTQDTAAVLDAGYLDLPANFVQKLRDMTEDVKAMMIEGEYVVNTMTAEEVRKLSQMIRTLNHAIKEVSTLYANLRFANVEMLGDESMAFMDAIGEIQKTSGMKDFVQWENALPYYAFKRFGKGGESIFEGLMDAQDKLAFLAQKIFNFQEKAWKGDEAKKWSEDTHTIDLPDGEKLTLTTADAMSIYCLSRRQQGLQHLLGGGVRVMGIQKDSQKAKDSRSTLTIKDIDAIISSLTDRQKKVAEAMQEFMSTTCSEWGNEISMKRFLTKEFNEKFYFPIESNDENLPTKDPSAQQSDLFRLLNISATKAIDPRANNEVIIRNIFDVFTGHASDMARLNAFGLPLLDYMKWLNYREKTVNEEGQIKVRGVRKYMETAYGNAAKSYVLNLIKDVNGRPSDNGDPSILMKWMRSAKTASVGSSLRVATLQLTSYPRAALVLSPKSLALGLTKAPKIEKAKKYCGIALWKSFGFYDTNISRSIEEQMKGVKDVKQKLIELSLKGAEIGDAITWGAMWNACEYEVASTKKYKVGSEEFYEAVGKKLREVVYRTQVVDSTLTRSQIMRSKRGMAQEAAAFMSEPTLSANILMDAGMEFGLEKRRTNTKTAWKKTGKYVTNALAVYSIGQLTAALLEGLWDAWRDDEDEEFGEKFASAFTENLVMDLVPFNKIPIVSDVFEAGLAMIGVGFYSSDKMSTTWLTQAVSAADAWRDVIGGNSSVTAYNALYKSVRALSSFYGVSASGVMREGVALWNNTAGAYDVTLKVLNYDRSKAELGSLLLDAIVEGNDRQADSLRAEFEDEDAYQSALRSAIKERYLDGEIDTSTAQKYLVQYGGKDGSKAHWLTEEWMYESGSDEDFGKYNKFFDAVKTGKNLKTVIKEYTANGVKPETLAGQITEHFKPEYMEMTRSEKASIKGYLLNAFEQCGVKREDAAKKLQHWEFLSEYPDSELNQSQVENYHEFAKTAGISAKLYIDYCHKAKGINKKEDRMNVIDSLPITSAQKDALYYAEGWAASKLNEAPWH